MKQNRWRYAIFKRRGYWTRGRHLSRWQHTYQAYHAQRLTSNFTLQGRYDQPSTDHLTILRNLHIHQDTANRIMYSAWATRLEIVKPPDKWMDSLCPNHNSIMSASEGGNFDMTTSISLAHNIMPSKLAANSASFRLLTHWPLQLIVILHFSLSFVGKELLAWTSHAIPTLHLNYGCHVAREIWSISAK